MRRFSSPCFPARRVAPLHHLVNELLIGLLRLKIATVTDGQRQFQVFTKMTVTHLDATVLMRLADVDRPGLQPVMIEHTLKPLIEHPLLLRLRLTMRHHTAVIQLKPGRQSAGLHGNLVHERLQGGKTLACAHTHAFSQRIGKHTMTDLMIKWSSANGDPHFIHIRPVNLKPFAGTLLLSKEKLLRL